MTSGSAPRPPRDADPERIYYAMQGVAAFCYALCFTVSVVYLATVVGLNPLQLVLVGTVLEITCFVCEVPTGVVADLRSRRLSIMIGFALIGLGFLLQGFSPTFVAVLGAQVLWGLGFTFTSGATQAWITDEVGEGAIAVVFTLEVRIQLVAGLLGTVSAGALSLLDIRLPILLAGAGFLLLVAFLAWRMPEQGFRPTPIERRETFGHLLRTARAGLALARRNTVVRGLLLISLITGLASEAFDRLWQVRLLGDFGLPTLFGRDNPGTWFALFALIGSLVSLVASVLVGRLGLRRLHDQRPGRVLAVLAAIDVLGILGLALFGSLWAALIAVWVKGAAAAVAAPVLGVWLNRQLPSAIRATALSIDSQANAIGQVVGGPPLGWLATRTSPSVALVTAGLIITPAIVIFALLDRRTGRSAP